MVSAHTLFLHALAGTALVRAHPRHAGRQESVNSSRPTVDLGYATYQGVRLAEGVDQFLGMRYAQAPLDDLRFRAPQDPLPESGVQDASGYSPLCLGVGESVSDPTYAEDCLFANVFRPSNATAGSKLPVWLFIQGGGYSVIGGFFNGTEVVSQSGGNIIFVNFNYRVGVLGFLATESMREDGDLNAGLQDQRKMLYWLQEHIAKFGGDPDHVVIHGLSAGAGSVEHHLTAFGGEDKGLFVGAIAQSTFWPTQRTVAEVEFQFDRLAITTGCATANGSTTANTTAVLACLRATDLATIQSSNLNLPFPTASDTSAPLWYWLPVTEGPGANGEETLVPSNLYSAFETGRFVRVPIVVGDDNDEGTVFASNASTAAEMSSFLKDNYPLLTASQLQAVEEAYPTSDWPPLPLHADYFPPLAAAYGEATFTCPGNTVAEAAAEFVRSESIWNYRVNVLDPVNIANGIGVPHVFENPAIWGPGNTGGYSASWDTTNAAIVPVIMSYYISFIRALDPNPYRVAAAPVWQDWGDSGDALGRRIKLQTNDTVMETVPQAQADRCALWKQLADGTEQ